MTKKQTQTLLSSNRVVAIIASAALLVSMMLVGFVLNDHRSLTALYDQQVRDNISNSYKAARITHCYDNKIHPCTDAEISAWNALHPEDALRLAAPHF